jgi:hypothetical protein
MFVTPEYEAGDRWNLLLPSSGYEIEKASPSAALIHIYQNRSSTIWKCTIFKNLIFNLLKLLKLLLCIHVVWSSVLGKHIIHYA